MKQITVRDFAILAHGDQQYAGNPFIFHLDQVAAIAQQYSHYWSATEFQLIENLCYLHDVLEDTKVSREEIAENFNAITAQLAFNLTDEPGANRKERKRNTWHKIRRNRKTIFVKLCDRIANTRYSKFTGEKIDMYRKEFPQFEAALYNPHEFRSMWEELRRETYE